MQSFHCDTYFVTCPLSSVVTYGHDIIENKDCYLLLQNIGNKTIDLSYREGDFFNVGGDNIQIFGAVNKERAENKIITLER